MSYSCSVKTVSRSGGRSATASAAYRNAELVVDKRTGERHDYTRRSGVESVSWFAPAGCREQTSAELWNRAEAAEKRRNATVAREVLVALPHELNQVQRLELVQRMTQQLAERYGVAGTAAIHAPDREGDQRNWHTHILMTTRRIDPSTGELGAKTRELDDMKTGPKEVVWIRQMVEREGNAALERAGHAARLDCRSLSDQGIDRAPTTHEGPRVTAIRRECEREQRDPLGACDVIELNDARRLPPLGELRVAAQQLEAEIIDLDQYRLKREIKQLSVPAPHPP
uniref:MobA/MobL family protein n=3 Tax=Bacillati TaxID=1783272 RepID=UPI003710EA7B